MSVGFAEDGGPFQRTLFGDYVVHDGRPYPMTIEISVYVPDPKTEIYRFSAQVFGEEEHRLRPQSERER